MNEERNQAYDDWLKKAVEEELSTREDLLPPWQKYPDIPRYSIGWRMGYGEGYMWTWDHWASQLNQDQLVTYFRKHTPLPVEWLDWVADALEHSVFDDILDGGGELAGIRWLEQQKLASFAEFKAWYDEFWGKQKSQR